MKKQENQKSISKIKKNEIGFIGLGRMGAAISAHLVEKNFVVHGFDVSEEARNLSEKNGVMTHESYKSLIDSLSTPKVLWLMVPSSFVDDVLDEVNTLLNEDDTIIDGGNSFFKDSIRRHQNANQEGIHYLDCGTSGGVEGARCGASLMVGGNPKTVKKNEHFFEAIATKNGYGHVGGPGTGHFVKMIHNGIEYGMMGAIAEGINILHEHRDDLEIDVCEAIKAYEHGSIVSSNLMSWLNGAYVTPGYLESIAGEVPKGETEIEMEYIISSENVHVLNAALEQRKRTRTKSNFIGTLISAMRNQFGGHKVVKKHNGN